MDRDEILKLLEKEEGNKLEFMKDVYTEEYLREVGLNERQIKAVMYVKERGRIKNREYQEVCGIKERLTTIELNDLVSKGFFEKHGTTGRGTYYTALKAQKPQERRTKGAKESSNGKKV